eukprot:scaffold3554_cov83-Skeletonema_marinoi.AAC.6
MARGAPAIRGAQLARPLRFLNKEASGTIAITIATGRSLVQGRVRLMRLFVFTCHVGVDEQSLRGATEQLSRSPN